MVDQERRKRVRELVVWLREHADEAKLDGAGAVTFASWAEMFAYHAEHARAEGFDEGEMAEVVLTVLALPREDLLEAEAVLRPLGYRTIAPILRRLARRAPPRLLTFRDHHRIVERESGALPGYRPRRTP